MELRDAIVGRRSIRKFTDEPIPTEQLQDLLELAAWAPSGQNLQPWHLVALTKREDHHFVLQQLGTTAFSHRKELSARFKNNPEVVEETMEFMTGLGGAPVIVLAFLYKSTYREEDLPSCIESVAAAMENLCLAAYDQGLGSCWVEGVCRVGEELRAHFAPDHGDLIGAVILGHPAMTAREIRRKPGRIVIR